jgi:hypothetical protein
MQNFIGILVNNLKMAAKVNIKYIRYYAVTLLLLSLLGTEIYYVPVCDFKLSAYRFFLAFLPVVCFFIPYKEFIANVKYGIGWFGAYLLLAWLPHALFSVYWSKDFAFTDNIIFFIGATLTALLLTGTSTVSTTSTTSTTSADALTAASLRTSSITSADAGRKNYLKVFYAVEVGICVLGLICCVQYLFNYIYMSVFSVSLLDQNFPEITLFGQESYFKIRWWDDNANVFVFSSFVIGFIGYFLDRRKLHLVFSIFFILILFLAK